MSLSAARETIATALATTTANVYSFPPAVVIPPAILIVPGDSYVEVATIGTTGARVRQTFRVTLAVAPIDNEATLDGIEDLMTDVLFAMPTSVGYLGGFSRPQMMSVGPSDLLCSDLTIQVMTGLEPEPTPPEEESEEA